MAVQKQRPQRLVVVGGVAAGASAAAKARRMNEEIEIVMLEAGPYISFANCGLPYFVGGEIAERDRLFVTSAPLFAERFGVQVRTGSRVVAVRPREHRVTVETAGSGPEELGYDRLVLATGTSPLIPPVPGIGASNLFVVRTVPDVDAIRCCLEPERGGSPARRAVVIGGGYIGLEMAEQLRRLGLEVALLEMADQVMTALDPEMALGVEEGLRQAGVELCLGDGLAEIEVCGDRGRQAVSVSGRRFPFDLAILAVGVRPEVELARQAGIRLGGTGAIAVDAFQRTSEPEIFAAGDNCEMRHRLLERPVNIPLAGPANKAGRVAGANAALDLLGVPLEDARRLRAPSVLGTAVVRVFDRIAAVTGLTEKAAGAAGIACRAHYMRGASHAGYYPGAESLLLKLLVEPATGRLLGAQGVGGEGVDKRIDVLATALNGGLSIEDLEELDLCYSPPVGSAKDVLIQAGFAGSNTRRGLMPELTPPELFAALEQADPPLVLDVRTESEFAAGHLEGAVNLPLDQLRRRLAEVPAGCRIAVYCRSGYRSYVAQRLLLNLGWPEVRNVQGGYLLIDEFRRLRIHSAG